MIDFEKVKNWSEERLMFEINEISEEIRKLEDKLSDARQSHQQAWTLWDNATSRDDEVFWSKCSKQRYEHIEMVDAELKSKKDTKERLLIILRSS